MRGACGHPGGCSDLAGFGGQSASDPHPPCLMTWFAHPCACPTTSWPVPAKFTPPLACPCQVHILLACPCLVHILLACPSKIHTSLGSSLRPAHLSSQVEDTISALTVLQQKSQNLTDASQVLTSNQPGKRCCGFRGGWQEPAVAG